MVRWWTLGMAACAPQDDPPPPAESDSPLPSYPSITQPDTALPTDSTTDTADTSVPSPTAFTGPAATARLANLSPDVPIGDVCLSYDGGATWTGPWFTTPLGHGLAQRSVTAPRDVPAGAATSRVVTGDAGCTTSVPGGNHELPVALTEGSVVQISILGSFQPPAGYEFAFIEALGFADGTTGPPAGAWMRFQHAAIGVTTAWPAKNEGGVLVDIGITETAFPGMKGYNDVPAFTDAPLVIRHGDDVLVDLGMRTLAAGAKVSLHLVGGEGLPLAVLWCDDLAPTVDGLTPCELIP